MYPTDFQANAILATKRGLELVVEVKKSGALELWQIDLWEHLLSEIGASYMALVALHNDKNVSAAAWMTRNLLELTVWVTYCVRSRDAAKRFYDDKARDVFDFLDAIEGLAKLGQKTDISIK